MKKIILLFILLTTFCLNAMAFSLTYDAKFSDTFIQSQVEKAFPIEKNKFFLTWVLKNPKISLREGEEFIYIDANVDIKRKDKIVTTTFVKLKSKVDFREKSKDIFLKDLTVIKIDNQHLSPKIEGIAKKSVQWVANKTLTDKPVFNLHKIKHEKLKKGTIKFVKKVYVKDQKLVLKVGI